MDKFYLPQPAVDHFRKALPKGAAAQEAWRKKFDVYKSAFPNEAAEFERIIAGKLPDTWAADIPQTVLETHISQ